MAIKFQDSLEVNGGSASKIYLEGAGGTGSSTIIQAHNVDDGAGHGGGTAYIKSSGWGEAELAIGSYRWKQAGGKMNVTGGVYYFNTGNVGIGVGSPFSKLHISGLTTNPNLSNAVPENVSLIVSNSDSAYGTMFATYGSGIGALQQRRTNTNTFYDFLIQPHGGRLGVGVSSPVSTLHVGGNARFDGYTYTNELRAVLDSGNRIAIHDGAGNIEFRTQGATERMTITYGGNVGIGTASPQELLDVRGSLYLSTGSTATTRIIPSANGGNSKLTFKGGNFYHYVTFETSWNDFEYASLKSSYNGGDSDFFLRKSDSTGAIVGNTKISTGISYFNGSLGIGTSNPNHKLDIYSDTNMPLRIHRPNSSLNTTEPVGIGFSHRGDSNNSTTDTRAGIFSSYNGDLFFSVDAGGRVDDNPIEDSALFIEGSNGNVGIGTTFPSQKLDVQGNIRVGNDTGYNNVNFIRNGGANVGAVGWDNDGYFYLGGHPDYGSGAGNSVRVWGFGQNIHLGTNAAGDVLTVNSAGNVGVGTENPVQKFQVDGNIYSNGGEIYVNGNKGITAVGNLLFKAHNGSNYFEGMRLASTGNVGIGNTEPATDLSLGSVSHISPDDTNRILNWYSATGGVEISNTSHYITVGQNSSDTTQPKSVGLALFNPNASNNTYSPAITFGGLSTSGNYMNGSAAISAQLIANVNDTNFKGGELTFYTQGTTSSTRGLTEKMRISANGNVGIGTTIPLEKLHILDNPEANHLAKIRIEGGATSGYSEFGTQSGYARIFSNGTQTYAANSSNTYWYIGGGSQMSLNSSGLTVNQSVNVGNSNTNLSQANSAGVLRVTTSAGWTNIGPANGSWSHFDTDRAQFYFNKPTEFNGTVKPYVHNNYDLGSDTKQWNRIYGRYIYQNGVQVLSTRAEVHTRLYSTGGNADDYTEFGIYRNYAEGGPIPSHNTILNVMQQDGRYGFQLGANTVQEVDGLYYRSKDAAIGPTWYQVASRDWVSSQGYASSSHTHSAADITSGTLDSARLSGTYGISVTGNSNALYHRDNRIISPSEDSKRQLRFGFTSFNNDNSAPWADYLHLRSYGDASGGNDNLVMFSKDSIEMRIWQQSFDSTDPYALFRDVAFKDELQTPAITSNGTTPSLNSGITASEVRSLINAEENGTTLPLSGGTLTGGLTIDYAAAENPLLTLFNDTNGYGAKIRFSDQSTPSQNGTLTYVHSDGNSYGAGNAFIFSGTETTMNLVALGNLMYRDGIYKTPSSGTGAGTRKDDKWDAAYDFGIRFAQTRLSGNADTITSNTQHPWDVSTATDAPAGSADGVLNTRMWDWDGWGVQSYHDFHTNTLYLRSRQNSVWQPEWATVWTSDNFNPTGTSNVYAGDTGVIFQSYNASASNAQQFRINHDYGRVEISNPRGEIEVKTSTYFESALVAEGDLYVGSSIQHWGDGGTGMYFSNDQVDIRTASTNRLIVGASGEVYFGSNTNKGYIKEFPSNTYGSQIGKIAKITFTGGFSDWDGENHAIVSKDINGNMADSLSINSYNDITIRLDSNNNNATSHFYITNDTLGSGMSNRLLDMNTATNETEIATAFIPYTDRTQTLGRDDRRWQIVFCEILDSAGQHEKNLQNPEGEKDIADYKTGTVLVWKGGKNVPCTKAADHMRMGIAVNGVSSPLIQGAEPVLVTGPVKEGDYLVTSTKEGHAEAISPEFMRQHNLFDCVLGKALEDGQGESHLIKTWINI